MPFPWDVREGNLTASGMAKATGGCTDVSTLLKFSFHSE